jgi:acetoin utilization protein AcuC
MSGGVALTYHERYSGRGFAPRRASWSRYELALRSFERAGLFRRGVRVYRQAAADDDELLAVHTRAYLERLAALDASGAGMVDGRQTPAYRGMLFRARIAVGGTLLASRLVMDGRVRHAFNPGGGLHHAHADRASGFCLLNDVAVAVRHLELRGGAPRVAVLDVDAHHGDGTSALLSDRVLVTSLHEYGGRFFPGTGAAADRGLGLALNLPLTRGDGDAEVLDRFARAEEAVRAFRPDLVVLLFGTDAHAADPFAHLRVSDAGFAEMAARTHRLAHEVCDGRLVALGAGGYEPETVARLWTALVAELIADPYGEARAHGEHAIVRDDG